jgi:hypothetical protein
MNLDYFTKWAYGNYKKEQESSDDDFEKEEERLRKLENLPDNLSSIRGTSLLRSSSSGLGNLTSNTQTSLNTKSKAI